MYFRFNSAVDAEEGVRMLDVMPKKFLNVGIHSLLLIGVGLSTSCGKLPDYEVLPTQNAFVADAEVNPNIDLLFVIDNSGSMQRDQQVLAASFSDFISNFTDKNLQYNIGVISTDTCPDNGDCTSNHWNPRASSGTRYPGILNNAIGGLLTRYGSNGVFYPNAAAVPAVYTPLKYLAWDSDPNPVTAKNLTISRFMNNAAIGITASGSEAPLSAVSAAVGKRSAYNDGFFRAGAFTAVIIVTDEDESYGWAGTPAVGSNSTQDYLSGRIAENCGGLNYNQCLALGEDAGGTYNSAGQNARVAQFLGSLETLKGAELDNFSLSVVAVPHNRTSCTIDLQDEQPDNFEPALTLHRVVGDVNATYGTLGSGKPKATFTDICTNFAPALNQIASDIVEANARYALAQPPANPAQIFVYVNNVQIPRSLVNGWEYDALENAIQFYGTAVPSVGDTVSIDYVPGAPI